MHTYNSLILVNIQFALSKNHKSLFDMGSEHYDHL